jgi:hypothetical protein
MMNTAMTTMAMWRKETTAAPWRKLSLPDIDDWNRLCISGDWKKDTYLPNSPRSTNATLLLSYIRTLHCRTNRANRQSLPNITVSRLWT